jgi:N-acetyl sugar amidotransferase
MIEKRNVQALYDLPADVKFCVKCTISNQRPRITFDADGVCSACSYAVFKRTEIDWDQRDQELQALCDRHRKTDGGYDVVVPCSGGKDGSFVAHQLKYKYDMNPLCVTWAPLKPTLLGRKNLDSFLAAGFDHILGTPNPQVTRKLTELSFKYIGDPFQPFIYGQTNFPMKMAIQHDVSLIMYGENGEVEYGGSMKNALSPTRVIADHDGHYFSGKPPSFWKSHGLSDADLAPFSAPPMEKVLANNTEMHFFGYYKFWDPQECYYYARENAGFSPNTERSEGTYSKYASLDDQIDGFHYYLALIKFGIGRTTSDTAHEIRDGKIERDEGIALIKKYDAEFPQKHFDVFLEFCNITKDEFDEIIDSWRSEHLWKNVDGQWQLKHQIDY